MATGGQPGHQNGYQEMGPEGEDHCTMEGRNKEIQRQRMDSGHTGQELVEVNESGLHPSVDLNRLLLMIMIMKIGTIYRTSNFYTILQLPCELLIPNVIDITFLNPLQFNTFACNCTNQEDVKLGLAKGVALAANSLHDNGTRK